MTKKLLNKKIVILDACTVSNGDVDFGTFESLGDVKIYDVLNGDELTEACREAEVLLAVDLARGRNQDRRLYL